MNRRLLSENVRSALRFTPGTCCLTMGLAHMAWNWWLIGNSMHLGSPLRVHGDRVIRSVSDPIARGHVENMHEIGLLGFNLLGHSMWMHFLFGVVLLAVGVIVTIAALQPMPAQAARQLG